MDKFDLLKAWCKPLTLLFIILMIRWIDYSIEHEGFWYKHGTLILFVLTPLIIAVSDTIEYIKERRKPIDPPDDIYECESDDDIAEKQQAIADAIDSRIKEKEFINKEE